MRTDYRQNANITGLALNKTAEAIKSYALALAIGLVLAVSAVAGLAS